MRSWDGLDPWELLGVTPDASVEEIRSAYEKLEQALAPGSLAVYSLLDADEQARLVRQLRTAYQRLLRAAGAPAPQPPPEPSPSTSAASPNHAPPTMGSPLPKSPPPIVVGLNDGREITGELLRAAREAWGLSVETIAKRTRIRPQYLVAIETEDFGAMPARVFARGFVMTYARELRLDPDRAWAGVERRWAAQGPIPRPGLPGR